MCKKIRLLKSVFSALVLGSALAMPQQSKADLLISDDFDYPVGTELWSAGVGTNGWLRFNGKIAEPIKIVEGSLTYDGYHPAAGNMMHLASKKNESMCLMKALYDGQPESKTGVFYYSALINIDYAPTSSAPFIGFARCADNGCFDANGVAKHGSIILKNTSGGYNVAIAKTNQTVTGTVTSKRIAYGATALVVVRYEFFEGNNNDRVSLWVNPTPGIEEPTPDYTGTSGTDPGSGQAGISAFVLTQGQTNSLTAATGKVDGVRVATTWADLFATGGSGETPAEPTITASAAELAFPATYSHFGTTTTLNIKATDLTDDITISGLTPEFTTAVTTVPKEAAMSEEGYDLVITEYLESATDATLSATLTLTSGSASATVALSGQVTGATKVTTAAEIRALANGTPYVYVGSATVTAVDDWNWLAYAQDATGGLGINYETKKDAVFTVGQEITKIAGSTQFSGAMFVTPMAVEFGRTDLTVEPTVLTGAQMSADLAGNVFKLITIEGVKFTPTEGQKFGTGTTRGTQDATSVAVMPLHESDVPNTEVPAYANITGVSRFPSNVTLIPRNAADIVVAAAPVEPPTLTISTAYCTIQTYSGFRMSETVNVKGANLTEDIAIQGLPEGFTTNVAAIPMDKAMSAEGFNLVLSYLNENKLGGYATGKITLTSGTATKELQLTGYAQGANMAKNAKEVQQLPTKTGATYLGNAIVTAVDRSVSTIYAQDAEGGLAIKVQNLTAYPEIGDVVTNAYGTATESETGTISIIVPMTQFINVEKGANTVEPANLTAAEIAADLSGKRFTLVKITDVALTAEKGQQFDTATIPASQNGTDFAINPAYGSSLIGKDVPACADITGVVLDGNNLSILARREEDVVAKAVVVPDPVITVAASLSMGEIYEGLSTERKLNIKATDLTEDITITGVEAPFYVATTTIAKEDAMSANGYDLVVNFRPTSGGNPSCTMTLTSGSAKADVAIRGAAYSVNSVKFSTAFNNLSDGSVCRYTGTATVTFVHPDSKRVYAQDMLGGICFDFTYFDEMPAIKAGDQLSNLFGQAYQEISNINMLQVMSEDFTVTDAQKTIEPLEVLASEIKASPESYIHRLVKITDVEFTPTDGQKFTTGFVRGTQNTTQVNVQAFSNTSLIGIAVPQQASITGVSTALAVVTVRPRSAEDVVEKALDPALEVTAETAFTGECAPMGQTTVVARFTADATALPAAASIWLGGANRDMFSLSTEELPAGTGKTIVEVRYTPTAIGKHTASINFDTTPTTLSYTKTFTFYAYDPANRPDVRIEPDEEIPPFKANVGETQEKEFKVIGMNLPDYGKIRVMGESNGAFVVNTTVINKGETDFKIIFKPTSEGTFTERIEFSVMMGYPLYVTVTGIATNAVIEEKEGDELPLSTLNPLKLMIEPFETNVVKNKALAIDGWKNLALDGTRAWWGYEFDNQNKAAKVTAYDSKIESGEGTPAQMMLVTPALDFVNSGSKILTFDVMGQNLRDDMTDLLEVVYIDMADGEMYVAPIEGIDIPTTAERNNEWVPVTVNFENSELADAFFIGFRFTSTRGCDNSAVYYIDNVTYGRTDLPAIVPAQTEVHIKANAKTASSLQLNIEGRNLTSDINVAVSGADAERFTVSPAILPAEGGLLTITFLAPEEGDYTAELILTADGAPATAIALSAKNDPAIEAIEAIDADAAGGIAAVLDGGNLLVKATEQIASVTIHNAAGTLLTAAYPAADNATINVATLGRGTAIVTVTTESNRTATFKVML